MDANTYQKEAQRTLIDVPDREIPLKDLRLIYDLVSIAVEIGKIVEYLKKGIFHQHGVDTSLLNEKLVTVSEMMLSQSPPIPSLTGQEIMKLWVLSGLIGETAEIGDNILTQLEEEATPPGMDKELGDVAWYWASIATQHNLALNDILISNVEKLQKRYQNGYSSEASKNRQE